MTDEQLSQIFTAANNISITAALRAVFDAGRSETKPIKEYKMQFEVYRSKTQFRWRLVAGNGEVVASGEAYKNKADVLTVIDLLKSTNDGVPTVDKTLPKAK